MITLNVWQRAMVLVVVSQARGDLRTLRLALRVLEALEFSDEEREALGLVEEGGQFRWDPAAAEELEIELELGRREAAFVKQQVGGYQGWPVAQAGQVFELMKVLGMEEGTTTD